MECKFVPCSRNHRPSSLENNFRGFINMQRVVRKVSKLLSKRLETWKPFRLGIDWLLAHSLEHQQLGSISPRVMSLWRSGCECENCLGKLLTDWEINNFCLFFLPLSNFNLVGEKCFAVVELTGVHREGMGGEVKRLWKRNYRFSVRSMAEGWLVVILSRLNENFSTLYLVDVWMRIQEHFFPPFNFEWFFWCELNEKIAQFWWEEIEKHVKFSFFFKKFSVIQFAAQGQRRTNTRREKSENFHCAKFFFLLSFLGLFSSSSHHILFFAAVLLRCWKRS